MLNIVQFGRYKGYAMKDTTNVKGRIVEVTTGLIEQYHGDTKRITARMIAEKAGVGLGLINYHFGSKENLITTCVQRVIGKVITGIGMSSEYASDREHLRAWAGYVFDFLFQYPAISRISILGELQGAAAEGNSRSPQRGFLFALTKNIADKEEPLRAFILTTAIQVAFLNSSAAGELLGYDLAQASGREAYIESLVEFLFEDLRNDDGREREEET